MNWEKKEGGCLVGTEWLTGACRTIVETVLATVVPTETSFVSAYTTALNNITTTVHVSASQTIDFTITVTESETATETATETETETETTTVTEGPAQASIIGPVKRHAHIVDKYGYDVPDYALCDDIYEYSSACDCVGFVPSTSTAPESTTTMTVTETLTASTAVVTETIATLSFTRNVTTIPITSTVTTVAVSLAVDTTTETTVVATTTMTVTNTVTDTTTVTFTETPTMPAPVPTYVVRISDGAGAQLENINVPPGAHIGVIATIRQTTNPATFHITPDGAVTLSQNPPTHVPYRFFRYESSAGYSYVQVTSDLVASIMGVKLLQCEVEAEGDHSVQCRREDGTQLEMWVCGRHLAVVNPGSAVAFGGTCATPVRRVNLVADVLDVFP